LNVLDFLDESRIEIGAQALGNCEGAFLKALNHAREREQFKRPIIDFQAIGHKTGKDVEPASDPQVDYVLRCMVM